MSSKKVKDIFDDSDDDISAPHMNLSSDEDDSFADVFKPQKKHRKPESEDEQDIDAGYQPPHRSHVCDECEGVFDEAVYCGECAMSYCIPCDLRYHAQSEDLKVHYRQPMHGSLPKGIARQVAQLQKEEKEELERDADEMLGGTDKFEVNSGSDPFDSHQSQQQQSSQAFRKPASVDFKIDELNLEEWVQSKSDWSALGPAQAHAAAEDVRAKEDATKYFTVVDGKESRSMEEQNFEFGAGGEARMGAYNIGNHRIQYVVPSALRQLAASNAAAASPHANSNVGMTNPPDSDLVLEHVHGYQSLHDNAQYLIDSDSIVYSVNNLVVVASRGTNDAVPNPLGGHAIAAGPHQRFFKGHDAPVSAVAVHPNRVLVASGQRCAPAPKHAPHPPAPLLAIWDSRAPDSGAIVEMRFHERSVEALAFSPDGTLLVSVGGDESHTLAVWRWASKQLIAHASVGIFPCIAIKPNPFASAAVTAGHLTGGGAPDDSFQFLTVGSRDLKLWNLNLSVLTATNCSLAEIAHIPTYSGAQSQAHGHIDPQIQHILESCGLFLHQILNLTYTTAVFIRDEDLELSRSANKQNKSKTIPSLALVGTSTGHILEYKDHHLLQALPAHKGVAITSMASLGSGPHARGFLSAGQDGKIIVWSNTLEQRTILDIAHALSGHPLSSAGKLNWNISNMSFHFGVGRLLLGTDCNVLAELDLSTSSSEERKVVHCWTSVHRNPIQALAIHPEKPIIVTIEAEDSVASASAVTIGSSNDTGINGISISSWDMQNRTKLPAASRPAPASLLSLCFDKFGEALFAGTDAGELLVLSYPRLNVLRRVIVSRSGKPITFITAAKSGGYVACAAGNNIYTFALNSSTHALTAKYLFTCHTAPIAQLAFSQDSAYLCSIDRAYSVHHWDLRTGIRIRPSNGAKFSSLLFSYDSQVLALGYETQGIYSKKFWMDGYESFKNEAEDEEEEEHDSSIMSARAKAMGKRNESAQQPLGHIQLVSKTRDTIAAGDKQGRIKLFPFPASNVACEGRLFVGSSGSITALGFDTSGNHLVSAASGEFSSGSTFASEALKQEALHHLRLKGFHQTQPALMQWRHVALDVANAGRQQARMALTGPKNVTIHEPANQTYGYNPHASVARSSSPPPVDGWTAASQAVAAYPINGGYAMQRSPSAAAGATGGFGSTKLAATRNRPQSAGGSRPMMVLKSTRPSSAAMLAATDSQASFSNTTPNPNSASMRTLPTRMALGTGVPTVPGKVAFGKNMLLHSTSSAMIHQLVPKKKDKSKAEKGAHAPQFKWGDLQPTALQLREMNDNIMTIKAEITSLETQKHTLKTLVLKKQRALKEIARIATRLAKQPSVSTTGNNYSQNLVNATAASSASPSKGRSGEAAALQEKIDNLRTSNEILRYEIEQSAAKSSALRDSSTLRKSGAKEMAQLERERRDLIKQVSVDRAARELDAFKRSQTLADLQFAMDEIRKTLEAKKKQTSDLKMQSMALENSTRGQEHEYQEMQRKLDLIAARH